jgi:hypothetical protein
LLPTKKKFQQELVRFCAKKTADAGATQKKIVGYWLLSCSGMVFCGVVLGIFIVYGTVLFCILLVIEKIVSLTRK